jgi:FADH2 O2-dependent halogenase
VKIEADLAVAGSGFAGSLVALVARRLGLSVALLERGSHPRFAIGESSSPLANLILESLCERYGLDRIRPLTKWGTWRRAYPEIGCGLKRGFTFYAHTPGFPFAADPRRRDQLLVAASPRDEIADTHWYRPDFDRFLVEEARSAGVSYVDRLRIQRVELLGGGALLDGEREGERVSVRARLVVDATGPRGLLARALEIGEAGFPDLPATAALYTHFSGVRRLEEMGVGLDGPEAPPFGPDDAAVHHVFPGGWSGSCDSAMGSPAPASPPPMSSPRSSISAKENPPGSASWGGCPPFASSSRRRGRFGRSFITPGFPGARPKRRGRAGRCCPLLRPSSTRSFRPGFL